MKVPTPAEFRALNEFDQVYVLKVLQSQIDRLKQEMSGASRCTALAAYTVARKDPQDVCRRRLEALNAECSTLHLSGVRRGRRVA